VRRKKMLEANVDHVAEMIVHSPKLRMEYFARPEKLLTRVAAEAGVQRDQRAKLGSKVEEKISKDSRLVSSREAYGERETFLRQAMRNPQVAFDTILWMSIVTFIIGIALVVGAFAAVFIFKDNTAQQVIIGGLSGGAGLVTTLSTVFAMSRQAIRRINGDNAQIRVILTAFATETTHLRAMRIDDLEQVKEINGELRQVMKETVAEIEKFVEAERTSQQTERGKGRAMEPARALAG
jgi:hypothetical protein